MFSTLQKVSACALGLFLGLGTLGQKAEATNCYSSDPTGTMAAIASSYDSGNYVVVDLTVANYTYGDPSLICSDSRSDAFHSGGAGGFGFQACGHNIYYGSFTGTHFAGDWAHNCNAAFFVY